MPAIEQPDRPESLANAMIEYVDVMDRMREGPVAPNKAPVPRDPAERANHMKAACYYLDASMAAMETYLKAHSPAEYRKLKELE